MGRGRPKKKKEKKEVKTVGPKGEIYCPSCLLRGEKRVMTPQGTEVDTATNERKTKLVCPKCYTWKYKPKTAEDIAREKIRLKAQLAKLEAQKPE